MPRVDEPGAKALGRFVGRAEAFGFAPPPVDLCLRALGLAEGWSALVEPAADAHPAQVVAWLPATGLLRLEFQPPAMRADFRAAPEAWTRALRGVALVSARLGADGTASVTVEGTRAALAALREALDARPAPPGSEAPPALLTEAQENALRTAVAAGYYRVPRALNLQQLARRLGVSASSLSERLRRAEGHVITRYVEARPPASGAPAGEPVPAARSSGEAVRG